MTNEPGQDGHQGRDRRWALPGVLFTVFVWGSYFPVLEVLLRTWDPLTVSYVRLLLAAGTLIVLLLAFEGARGVFIGVPWPRVVLLGVVGIAGNMTIIVFGIQHSGAVPAALIAGAVPALAAVMGRLLVGQRFATDLWVAIALATVGVGVVAIAGQEHDFGLGGGELLVLVSFTLWLWYLFMAQAWLGGMSQLRLSTLTMSAGAVGMTGIYGVLAAVGYGPIAAGGSFDSLALLVYSAVFSVAIGVVLWNYGVSRLGVTVTSLYGNLAPVIAVAMSAALGASVTWLHLLGGAMVFAGVLYVQLRPRLVRGQPVP